MVADNQTIRQEAEINWEICFFLANNFIEIGQMEERSKNNQLLGYG